jgi:hypothetical protein
LLFMMPPRETCRALGRQGSIIVASIVIPLLLMKGAAEKCHIRASANTQCSSDI